MTEMSVQARAWVTQLGLRQHPEGGWYVEVYRADGSIPQNVLPQHHGARPFITSIFFMLAPGEVSHFHRLKSDEIWYHHAGGSLTVHQIDQHGGYRTVRLGQNLGAGDCLQVVVRAGTWFGATVNDHDEALVGCAVAPGFDFAEFELALRADLLAEFPQHEKIIFQLTRSPS